MNILIIAHNTFRETIRDRVLRVIVGLSLLVILASKAIGEVTLGQELKLIANFSLGAIDLFGVILCVFIGTGLIYKEIEKKTLYTVLARPIYRWEFVVGKYLGMGATLATTMAIMSIVFCIFYWLLGGKLNWNIPGAVFLLFMGLMLLNSIAIFFSTMASPTVSAIATTAIFLVGRFTFNLKFLAELAETPILKKIIMGAYYILPNLHHFNIKKEAYHDLIIRPEIYFYAIPYAILYSIFMLYLATLVLNKRNL